MKKNITIKDQLKINGIAHIALNVSSLNRSKQFYDKILPKLGLILVHSSANSFYYVGGKTGLLFQRLITNKKKNYFSQSNIGLHHFCFRMRSKKAIDKFYLILKKNKVKIIRGPIEGGWVPGYYYIVFEDPDKIRLEVNYVPKQGVFEKNVSFNPLEDY